MKKHRKIRGRLILGRIKKHRKSLRTAPVCRSPAGLTKQTTTTHVQTAGATPWYDNTHTLIFPHRSSPDQRTAPQLHQPASKIVNLGPTDRSIKRDERGLRRAHGAGRAPAAAEGAVPAPPPTLPPGDRRLPSSAAHLRSLVLGLVILKFVVCPRERR